MKVPKHSFTHVTLTCRDLQVICTPLVQPMSQISLYGEIWTVDAQTYIGDCLPLLTANGLVGGFRFTMLNVETDHPLTQSSLALHCIGSDLIVEDGATVATVNWDIWWVPVVRPELDKTPAGPIMDAFAIYSASGQAGLLIPVDMVYLDFEIPVQGGGPGYGPSGRQ